MSIALVEPRLRSELPSRTTRRKSRKPKSVPTEQIDCIVSGLENLRFIAADSKTEFEPSIELSIKRTIFHSDKYAHILERERMSGLTENGLHALIDYRDDLRAIAHTLGERWIIKLPELIIIFFDGLMNKIENLINAQLPRVKQLITKMPSPHYVPHLHEKRSLGLNQYTRDLKEIEHQRTGFSSGKLWHGPPEGVLSRYYRSTLTSDPELLEKLRITSKEVRSAPEARAYIARLDAEPYCLVRVTRETWLDTAVLDTERTGAMTLEWKAKVGPSYQIATLWALMLVIQKHFSSTDEPLAYLGEASHPAAKKTHRLLGFRPYKLMTIALDRDWSDIAPFTVCTLTKERWQNSPAKNI